MAGTITHRTYWSKSPEEAPPYSDWKITFTKKGSHGDGDDDRDGEDDEDDDSDTAKNYEASKPCCNTYHVHRNMIGPQSQYFTRVFYQSLADVDDASFWESHNQHSRIEFSNVLSDSSFDSIVSAFEMFLAYCYFQEECCLGMISPVALNFVRDYFQIHYDEFIVYVGICTNEVGSGLCIEEVYPVLIPICQEIINFRSEGLNVETIQSAFVERCGQNRDFLRPTSSLSDFVDTAIWIAIASYLKNTPCPKEHSEDWSTNIAYFITKNKIETTTFRMLTNKQLIPTIHAEAAVVLLKEESEHGFDECFVEEYDIIINGDHENDEVIINETTMLSNLQERCVDSFDLAKLENDADFCEEVLAVMTPSVMKAYVRKNLLRTREINEAQNTELERLRRLNEQAIDDQIIDGIARHQNEFSVTKRHCVRMLPDTIPEGEILDGINDLVERQRIIDNGDYYTVGQDVLNDRAFQILRGFKINENSNNPNKMSGEQLYSALSRLIVTRKDMDCIISNLSRQGLITTDSQNPEKNTSTVWFTIH